MMREVWLFLIAVSAVCGRTPEWCYEVDPAQISEFVQCGDMTTAAPLRDNLATKSPGNSWVTDRGPVSTAKRIDDWKSYLVMGDSEKHADRSGEARSALFEGDILGTEKGTFNVSRGSLMANAARNPQAKWPKGIVPYEISPLIPPRDQKIIRQAMDNFHRRTCIRFVPHTNEPDYISIESLQGCSSYVGRVTGKQPVSLEIGQCYKQGKVEHELMHAIGFVHEQSRTDRDQYVTINWDNIPSSDVENFQKYGSDAIDSLGAEYDYGSVLHYGPFYFAVDPGMWTILPRVKGKEIGQRSAMSDTDIWKINKLYGCQATGKTEIIPSLPPPPTPACPVGWINFIDKCYYFSFENARPMVAWDDASEVCEALLGRLASIPDDATNQFIEDRFKNSFEAIWIGSRVGELALTWNSLKNPREMFYTNWGETEPKTCVQISKDGRWHMEFCGLPLPYVCERESIARPFQRSPSAPAAKTPIIA